jgi:4-diphosphocytidyl-2-C-methyl-D-erythritol kinase
MHIVYNKKNYSFVRCKMNYIDLNAYAKINLSLDVIKKRPDGYHDVKMIMQTISLHDKVFLEVIDKGIKIECNVPYVPVDERNIAHKAASVLIEKFRISKGVKIILEKSIPVAAGLAGGSTNAAAVLKGMNTLFGLGLTNTQLRELGKQNGADVPFCLAGGTMLSEGIGEILAPLPGFNNVSMVLVKPKISVSTAWVYNSLELQKITLRPDTDLLIEAIKNKNIKLVSENMVNVLETVTIEKYSVINEIKNKLLKLGAEGSLMSGSGPTVFGVFKDFITANNAYEAIKSDKWESFLTSTLCEVD